MRHSTPLICVGIIFILVGSFVLGYEFGSIPKLFPISLLLDDLSTYEFVISTGIVALHNGPVVYYRNITIAYYGSYLQFSGDSRFSGWVICRPTNQMGSLKGMIVHYVSYSFYVETWDDYLIWLQEIVKK